MVRAGRILNSGDTETALDIFTVVRDAFEAIDLISLAVEAEQMRGICLRMLRRYNEAEYSFMRAHARAEGRVKKAHILRDWCMVPLERGNITRALQLINDSLELLGTGEPDETPKDKEKRLTEQLASLGFKCRVAFRMDDQHFARKEYVTAREGLRGRDATYELNTTVWEMKDVSLFGERLTLAPRALWLAAKAGNLKRIVQIVLLVICRPLARHLSKN